MSVSITSVGTWIQPQPLASTGKTSDRDTSPPPPQLLAASEPADALLKVSTAIQALLLQLHASGSDMTLGSSAIGTIANAATIDTRITAVNAAAPTHNHNYRQASDTDAGGTGGPSWTVSFPVIAAEANSILVTNSSSIGDRSLLYAIHQAIDAYVAAGPITIPDADSHASAGSLRAISVPRITTVVPSTPVTNSSGTGDRSLLHAIHQAIDAYVAAGTLLHG
jgi:hypothetical protein